MKEVCQTCEYWGWMDWDEARECWHPGLEDYEKGCTAFPTDSCGCWKERKDKSSDGPASEQPNAKGQA